MTERYGCISGEQWAMVLKLLAEDVRSDNHGIAIYAPEFPELGEEAKLFATATSPGMVWFMERGRPLSEVILMDNDDFACLKDMADGLENTVRILRTALTEKTACRTEHTQDAIKKSHR